MYMSNTHYTSVSVWSYSYLCRVRVLMLHYMERPQMVDGQEKLARGPSLEGETELGGLGQPLQCVCVCVCVCACVCKIDCF